MLPEDDRMVETCTLSVFKL